MSAVPKVMAQGHVITKNLPLRIGFPRHMTSGALANWLDQRRLHLQHGPIDLIVAAEGAPARCASAYANAADAFDGLLGELVDELPQLRQRAALPMPQFKGPVANRMATALMPHVPDFQDAAFITPMAAVAGSVADHVLAAMGNGLDRAYINNGGDIAIYLGAGTHYDIGIADNRDVVFSDYLQRRRGRFHGKMPVNGRILIRHDDGVGGVATSGWRGRSLSLGIADSVTVLAANAAAADIAATLIANAVNVDIPAICRAPANTVDDNSDLGERLVTVGVGELSRSDVETALANGRLLAERFHAYGHIVAAYGRLKDLGFFVG